MTFERFSIVRVPFPFNDRNATKNRPAIVLSDSAHFNRPAGHSVLAIITSTAAENSTWPLDCEITDLGSAGLPVASKVRFKLFTLDNRVIRGVLGKLAAADEKSVRDALNKLLGQ